jgi:hypothetical protein
LPSTMVETWTNVDSYYLSHNYWFEATNFSSKALHQHFDPRCIIHICNMISFITTAIGIIWPQLIKILSTSFILMTMGHHTHDGNGQLSKPKYHFVAHLQPWKCNFCTIHLIINNA